MCLFLLWFLVFFGWLVLFVNDSWFFCFDMGFVNFDLLLLLIEFVVLRNKYLKLFYFVCYRNKLYFELILIWRFIEECLIIFLYRGVMNKLLKKLIIVIRKNSGWVLFCMFLRDCWIVFSDGFIRNSEMRFVVVFFVF